MKAKKTLLMQGFLTSVILILVNCAGEHLPHATHNQNVVMCDKCRISYELTGSHSVRHPTKVMICPDCDSAVENFIKTGRLKHHCSHCNGTMTCETRR